MAIAPKGPLKGGTGIFIMAGHGDISIRGTKLLISDGVVIITNRGDGSLHLLTRSQFFTS